MFSENGVLRNQEDPKTLHCQFHKQNKDPNTCSEMNTVEQNKSSMLNVSVMTSVDTVLSSAPISLTETRNNSTLSFLQKTQTRRRQNQH